MSSKLAPMRFVRAMRFARIVASNDLQVYLAGIKPRVRYLELAWCNPLDIRLSTRFFVSKHGGFLHSGSELSIDLLKENRNRFIAPGDWDQATTPIADVKHISRTVAHFEKGLDWQATGEVSWMMENIAQFGVQDGCRSFEDVTARCEAIDKLKSLAERDGRLLSRRDLNPGNFREKGGIGISLSRTGELIWFSDGAHRLAIARLLRLEEIPVCLHMIHAEAALTGAWQENI